MKTLNRYIFSEIMHFFFICLTIFLGILVTARILKLTSLVINKGVEFLDIVIIFMSIVPSFLELAIPMSVLLATLLAFARLSSDSEIVVMRASGISLLALIRPVALFGLAATSISFLVALYLRPIGNATLANYLFKVASSHTTSGLTAGVFNELGNIVIYAEKINHSTGDLEHVLIDDRRKPDQRLIIVSQSGVISSNKLDRTINIKLFDGTIHTLEKNDTYNLTLFGTNNISVPPDELAQPDEQKGKRPRELLIPELKTKIAILEPNLEKLESLEEQSKMLKYVTSAEIEIARRITMPLACVILALLAMPLGIHPPRSQNSWGPSLCVIIALVVFVLYYGLLSVGMSLSKDGSVSPYISLWIPNIICALIATMTLKKMGSEQWNSFIQAFEQTLSKFSKKLFPS
ncbi:MAG: LPS export ABC transporter permease LptF [Deltaproteobacteria bacterium]|nr:LPS export ABC transporter permease LptF [Deltaproteobacteria bacterium]